MKIRPVRQLIFSIDLDSYFKSIWIGWLLITFVWQWDEGQLMPSEISFSWYGWGGK